MALVTRGDLKRHVGLKLGLDQTAASDEALLMEDWAQQGVRDVLLETHANIQSSTLALSAGVGDYTLAVLAVVEVTLTSGSQKYNLTRVGLGDILDMRRTLVANDTPRYYAADNNGLYLYPTPALADTITIYGVPDPTDMSNDNNDITTQTFGGIPKWGIEAVEYYMLWQAAEYDEKRTPHTPADYRKMYNEALARLRTRLRRQGGRKMPGGVVVGYPGRNVSLRNDIYP